MAPRMADDKYHSRSQETPDHRNSCSKLVATSVSETSFVIQYNIHLLKRLTKRSASTEMRA